MATAEGIGLGDGGSSTISSVVTYWTPEADDEASMFLRLSGGVASDEVGTAGSACADTMSTLSEFSIISYG